MALDKYCCVDSRKLVLRNWWWRLLMGGKLIDFGSCSCTIVVWILGMW